MSTKVERAGPYVQLAASMSMANHLFETKTLSLPEEKLDMHQLSKMFQLSLGEGQSVAAALGNKSGKGVVDLKDILGHFAGTGSTLHYDTMEGPLKEVLRPMSRLSQAGISAPSVCVLVIMTGQQKQTDYEWSRALCVGGMHDTQYYLIDPASGALEMSKSVTQDISGHILSLYGNRPASADVYYKAFFIKEFEIPKLPLPPVVAIKAEPKGKEEEEEPEKEEVKKDKKPKKKKTTLAARKRKRSTRKKASPAPSPQVKSDKKKNKIEKEEGQASE